MPEFTAVYLNPEAKYVSRGLLQGFCITDPLVDAYTVTGRIYTWTLGTVTAVIALKDAFYQWNSGLWALGEVVDVENCHILVSGEEVDGGAFFYWDWLPDRANIVLCSSIFFPVTPTILFELPVAPAEYWLTLPALQL